MHDRTSRTYPCTYESTKTSTYELCMCATQLRAYSTLHHGGAYVPTNQVQHMTSCYSIQFLIKTYTSSFVRGPRSCATSIYCKSSSSARRLRAYPMSDLEPGGAEEESKGFRMRRICQLLNAANWCRTHTRWCAQIKSGAQKRRLGSLCLSRRGL